MPSDRLIAIFGLIAHREQSQGEGGTLCAVAAEIIALSGAGIALVSSGRQLTAMCTSDSTADRLMDIELTIGEGFTTDACQSNHAIEEPDLMDSTSRRWPVYTPLALHAGARAVFGFPVQIGAIRLGALSLYRDSPGPLSDSQTTDAYLMASVIGRAVLALQAGAPRGSLSEQLENEATFDFAVHQAAGMVAVQGSMSVGDALVALRSHAFTINSPLSTLATRVVVRKVRFEPHSRTWRNALDGVK